MATQAAPAQANVTAVLGMLQQVISFLVGLCKTLIAIGLVLLALGTIANAFGEPIPHIPGLRASFQEIGVFFAGMSWWLKHS